MGMTRKRLIGATILAVILMAGAAVYGWWGAGGAAPGYRLARIERGTITAVVSATGTVNPVVSVQVGSQVSGQIKEIYVDFNSEVKKNQVIARIDPATFDLSVKNPAGGEEVTHRSPEDILDEIAALDVESAEVLATVRGLL